MVVNPNLWLAVTENTAPSPKCEQTQGPHNPPPALRIMPRRKEKMNRFLFPKKAFLSLLEDMVGWALSYPLSWACTSAGGHREWCNVIFLMAGDSRTQTVLVSGCQSGPEYSCPPSPAIWRVSICMKAVLEGKQRQTNAFTAGESVGGEMGIAMGGSSCDGWILPKEFPVLKAVL